MPTTQCQREPLTHTTPTGGLTTRLRHDSPSSIDPCTPMKILYMNILLQACGTGCVVRTRTLCPSVWPPNEQITCRNVRNEATRKKKRNEEIFRCFAKLSICSVMKNKGKIATSQGMVRACFDEKWKRRHPEQRTRIQAYPIFSLLFRRTTNMYAPVSQP